MERISERPLSAPPDRFGWMRRFVWPVAEYLEASRPVKAPSLTLLPVRLFPFGDCAGNLLEIGDMPFRSVAHQ